MADNRVMGPLHKIDDRNLLTSVLNGDGVYLGPAAVLEGLSDDQARAKPHDLSHAIAASVDGRLATAIRNNHLVNGGREKSGIALFAGAAVVVVLGAQPLE